MSTRPTASSTPAPHDEHRGLFRRFYAGEDRRAARRDWVTRFGQRMAHKGADLPLDDEEMQVNANHSRGITWRELAVVGVVGLAAAWLWRSTDRDRPPPHPAAATSPQPGDQQQQFTVRFYDRFGKPIDVPHISKRPPDMPPHGEETQSPAPPLDQVNPAPPLDKAR